MEIQAFDIEDLSVGQYATYKTKFTKDVVNAYADIVGDKSPLHVDEEYVKKTEFEGNIVHGMLIASHFSTIVGVLLPGRKALLMSMNIEFINPLIVGSEVTISGRVEKISQLERVLILSLRAYCNNAVCVRGNANVKIRQEDN